MSRPLLTTYALLAVATIPAASYGATHQVTVQDFTFAPATLNIQVGDTVRWTNAGGIHNVDADDGSFTCANGCNQSGGNGTPASNAWSFELTFGQAGTIGYHCDVHVSAGMRGTINVQGGTMDPPGALRFATGTPSVAEGAGNATLTVQRVGGDDGAVSVQYATSNGTATAGPDYLARSGTLSWPDNDDDPRTLQVPVIDDSEVEGNETFRVTLSNPTGGASLGSPSVATVTIVDDDQGPPPPPEECVEDQHTLCLVGGRFRVEVDWATATRPLGPAQALPLKDNSGLFFFVNENNIELLIKVLNACGFPQPRYWVFFAATTNVEFRVTVTDTVGRAEKRYFNPLGMAALPEQDTQAFATCP